MNLLPLAPAKAKFQVMPPQGGILLDEKVCIEGMLFQVMPPQGGIRVNL